MALRAQALRPTTGYEGLSGQLGRVTQDLNPEGMVQVWGERWRARSVADRVIPAGSEVEGVVPFREHRSSELHDVQFSR